MPQEKEWWEEVFKEATYFATISPRDEVDRGSTDILNKLYLYEWGKTIKKIISEANRRRDEEWREKLEGMEADEEYRGWNAALEEVKKITF